MTELKGKWVLITGASRGIGRLAAVCMAQQGCNLILHSRKKAGTAELAEEVSAMGVEAYSVEAELSDTASVAAMLKEIDDTGTQVDVILNNAGLQIGYRVDYLNTPLEDFPVSFAINTIAPMQICYHFLPGMIERGFGRIVNTTSGIALEPEQAGYSASKAALDKVSIDLGSKLRGSDVIISLADPGWCRTDLGGPMAPNAPESAVPGVVVGAFVNDGKSGRIFRAQEYAGMTLADAVAKAEQVESPYQN
ncbi:MAG: SDR family oxidoreductase [Oscillospiraceae bacterium]|nr:SDR family oxidoreductase [Oscillospiraceae bacterium]